MLMFYTFWKKNHSSSGEKIIDMGSLVTTIEQTCWGRGFNFIHFSSHKNLVPESTTSLELNSYFLNE